MGILYNRFTPEPQPQSLIPYSNQSNIVSYLVPSSFQGSSSTIWGDDYLYPMDIGEPNNCNWSLNSDNSVHLSWSSALGNGFRIDMSTNSNAEFSIYAVLKYNANDTSSSYPCLRIINSSIRDTIESYYAINQYVYMRVGSITTGRLTPVSSAFGNYHVYAFRQRVNSRYSIRADHHHVIDNGQLTSARLTNPPVPRAPILIYVSSSEKVETSIDVKFLSIVKGAESDSTILNNVNNIMTKLNIP